jgi:hypothetical protein
MLPVQAFGPNTKVLSPIVQLELRIEETVPVAQRLSAREGTPAANKMVSSTKSTAPDWRCFRGAVAVGEKIEEECKWRCLTRFMTFLLWS